MSVLVACFIFQFIKIYPYTPFAPYDVGKPTSSVDPKTGMMLLTSNVLQKNTETGLLVEEMKKLNPDVVLISTFNKVLDNQTIKLSKFINIHHGKLPKQKGRASINWAIIMGRNNIFITIHEVTAKLDSGKIILQKKVRITKNETEISLDRKIIKEEHKLYPAAISKIFD